MAQFASVEFETCNEQCIYGVGQYIPYLYNVD